MRNSPSSAPIILFIGGHDPSGGAGLQADLETAARHNCRAISLLSCLTIQDTRNVRRLQPLSAQHFFQQAECLLADIRPDWVKVGLLGDAELAEATAELLIDLRVPLVLDPVLAAGGGTELADQALLHTLSQRLLPMTRLLTPNRAEARRLSGESSPGAAAQALQQAGCEAVLITGADETEEAQVCNQLYQADQVSSLCWPRLSGVYHGSGCTLASACACQLALGRPLPEAVKRAQQYTWDTLKAAENPGSGQYLPNRRGASA